MRSLRRYLAETKSWDRPRIEITFRVDYDAHPRLWKAASKLNVWLYAMGISEGGHSHYTAKERERSCGFHIGLGWRIYILGWPRWKWACLLLSHHWPGEQVLGQTCGKCFPWPCCGARTLAHADGCKGGDE